MRVFLQNCGWQEGSERISLVVDLTHFETQESEHKYDAIESACLSVKADDDVSAFIEHEFSRSWAIEAMSADDAEKWRSSFCIVLSDKDTGDYLGFAAINTANRNWFGPMGVRRDCRSKGLGRLLVKSAFLRAKENGINSLILPWVNEKEMFYNNIIQDIERQVFFKFETDLPTK